MDEIKPKKQIGIKLNSSARSSMSLKRKLRSRRRHFNNTGSGLLSLLFTAVIIGLVYYFAFDPKKRAEMTDKDSYLKQMSVDATSYNSMLESAKKAVEASRPKE